MADNYLEKRYDEVFGNAHTKTKKVGPTLDELMTRNRSCRGYNKNFVVTEQMLRKLVEATTKAPSARNQQALRYRLVTRGAEANAVLALCKMGGALPQLNLPLKGTEPEAFIVVCGAVEPSPMLYIDLGIAALSMLLKATETGLNGLIIEAFDHAAVKMALNLPLEPLMVIAIGKSAEKHKLVPAKQGDDLKYYRDEEGTHCVPKLKADDLILK
ncbi:MAG: nitroreductase family protein [Bacteroidales bacterium]|nr:nitroreductase family protein [Bacteroidales bacterium]